MERSIRNATQSQRDSEQSGSDIRKCGGKNCAATIAEDQPEGADAFSDVLFHEVLLYKRLFMELVSPRRNVVHVLNSIDRKNIRLPGAVVKNKSIDF